MIETGGHNKLSRVDQEKLDSFLTSRIEEAFNLFSKEKGYIDNEDVPAVMQYLGQFPSIAQINSVVLPENKDDEKSNSVSDKKFIPNMLRIMKEKEFQPDETETLLAAFKLLDTENKGFIDVEMMKTFLTKEGIEFDEAAIENFIKFATNGDSKATVIYYEDYISRLNAYVEKHMENLWRGYNTYQIPKK